MRRLKIALPLAAAIVLGMHATALAVVIHTVAPGESLSSIAAIDGLSVEQLAAANGLPPTAELIAGSELAIPPQTEIAPAGSASMTDDGEPASPAASSATSQPVGAAAQGAPGAPPYPTAEMVTPQQVGEIAGANGVPPSLASAIADQESGFNNGLTSTAEAVGVMQITPGTWAWINEALTGSVPLSPASALENVRGGVTLLHSLLEATGGDEALAAAGYYQGLPSVLQNGVYPSTQQYVEDVQALQQRFAGG